MMKIRNLAGRVGEEILVAISGCNFGRPQRAILDLVDENGIWVEGRELVELLLSPDGIAMREHQVVFLPFTQILYITDVTEVESATRLRFKW
ncbi:MAG TPA: hypothetical protein VLW84_12385 [Terriglobales bacterium]|nr:hypothetical protein [Terriglobales bacterium]